MSQVVPVILPVDASKVQLHVGYNCPMLKRVLTNSVKQLFLVLQTHEISLHQLVLLKVSQIQNSLKTFAPRLPDH